MLRSQGIEPLKGRYSGECAIIANGASLVKTPLKAVGPALDGIDQHKGIPAWVPLAEHRRDLLTLPLWEIPVPIWTMNRSWMMVWPTLGHCVVEEIHQRLHPAVYEKLADEGKMFSAGGVWPSDPFLRAGYNTKIASDRSWSTDLVHGVVVSLGICGTVTLATMQFAAYLGFTKLWMLGLDLEGPQKFSGHGTGKLVQQRELFRMAAPHIAEAGVEVAVVGPSQCDAFPQVSFPWPLTNAGPRPILGVL